MKVINYARWVLVLALPLVASAGNASTDGVYSYDAPGIGAPSWPLFLDSNETLNVRRNGSGLDTYWTLTGIGSTASLRGSENNSVELGRDFVKYVANFNSAGQLITSIGSQTLTNYLQIKGSLPAGTFGGTSWPDQPSQLLLSATLLDSNSGNGTPDLIGIDGSALGFKTQFTGGWAANNIGLTGGSTGENLWLFGSSSDFTNLVYALDGIDSNGTLNSLIGSFKTIADVSSISSVPLPGAVWLFLAGLMTFLGRRSKRAGTGFAS